MQKLNFKSGKRDLSMNEYSCYFSAFLHIVSSNSNYIKILICRPLDEGFTYMLKYFHDFRNLFEFMTPIL